MKWYCICIMILIGCSEHYNFNPIHFHDGTINIMESDSSFLYENLDILIENAEIEIILEGHTNSVGGDSANMVLSQARADAIKSWLIANDVDVNRITTIGHGETNPVVDNRTAEGRALNDRVEFKNQ
ncbi:MAG: OmpA family protein [bacterium]